jgi:hypothetical protein
MSAVIYFEAKNIAIGTAADFVTADPILPAGWEGYETDTQKGKIGDGVTAFSGLAYRAGGGGGGSGTVTSVGLSLPSSLFDVTGSPVTSSGSLTGTLATQNANKVLAGPTSGGDAAPTIRALVAADIPALSYDASGAAATAQSAAIAAAASDATTKANAAQAAAISAAASDATTKANAAQSAAISAAATDATTKANAAQSAAIAASDTAGAAAAVNTTLSSHTGNTSNPHSVTKAQVGLSNVDNTSDVNKPVSTAQATADALNLKIVSNLSDLNNVGTARTNLGLGTAALLAGVSGTEVAYSGTPSWTFGAGNAPSSTANLRQFYTQIGNGVIWQISLTYATTGTAVTNVSLTFPTEFPTPAIPTGFTGASVKLYSALLRLNPTPSGTPVAANLFSINRNAANTGFEISGVAFTSGSYRTFIFTGSYFTA